MKREHIEEMISQIDENYIKETLDTDNKKGCKKKKRNIKIEKWAAAAAVCAIVLGTGITVTAATSDVFRGWLTGIFGGHEITKVKIEPKETPAENTTADLPTDKDDHLYLEENMEIQGVTESFVYQYHVQDEKMVVDELYSICNDGLKKWKQSIFKARMTA